MANTSLKFDPSDWDGMIDLMDKYGDSEMPFDGKNQDGEAVLVSISKDNIAVRTYQNNGWIRINTYWRDGTTEETYDGSGN